MYHTMYKYRAIIRVKKVFEESTAQETPGGRCDVILLSYDTAGVLLKNICHKQTQRSQTSAAAGAGAGAGVLLQSNISSSHFKHTGRETRGCCSFA